MSNNRAVIRQNTKNIHKYVESLPIMESIMKQTITPKAYIDYLMQLYAIYNAIEMHPLYTSLNLKLHLSGLCYNDVLNIKAKYNIPESDTNILKVTKLYCDMILNINDKNALLGHCYVRYMADLKGGQMIKKVLPKEWSTQVYDIPGKYADMIINHINELDDIQLFESNVNLSFMSHLSILSLVGS